MPTSFKLFDGIPAVLGETLHLITMFVAFIGFFWVAVKRFDKGSGLVLHALWVAPFFFVPTAREY